MFLTVFVSLYTELIEYEGKESLLSVLFSFPQSSELGFLCRLLVFYFPALVFMSQVMETL